MRKTIKLILKGPITSDGKIQLQGHVVASLSDQ